MQLFAILTVLLLITKPAYAYIGPAIAFIGYLLGPFAAVIAAVAMIVGWPVYALFKKYRKNKSKPVSDTESGNDTDTPST